MVSNDGIKRQTASEQSSEPAMLETQHVLALQTELPLCGSWFWNVAQSKRSASAKAEAKAHKNDARVFDRRASALRVGTLDRHVTSQPLFGS